MIKILKSGDWALEGTRVVELTAGEETTFGPSSDFELVQAGWAEWFKVEAPVEVPADKPARKTKAE